MYNLTKHFYLFIYCCYSVYQGSYRWYILCHCEMGPTWISLVFPSHPTDDRLDIDLENFEVKSTPCNLKDFICKLWCKLHRTKSRDIWALVGHCVESCMEHFILLYWYCLTLFTSELCGLIYMDIYLDTTWLYLDVICTFFSGDSITIFT